MAIRQRTLKILLLSFIIIIALTSIPTYAQSPLRVTVTTDKPSYKYREIVNVGGNLTLSGAPVDGFVGIEVGSLNASFTNYTRLVTRTATIGNPYIGAMNITIESVITCGGPPYYVPKTTFKKGETLYANISVVNNYFNDRMVTITVLACDSDSTPITSHVAPLQTKLLGGGGGAIFYPQFIIDTWVSTGPAKIYANVYSDWPSEGGHPWCHEKSASFTIIPATGAASYETYQQTPSSNNPTAESVNTYDLSFRLPPYAPFGNYSVNATAFAQGWEASNYTTFGRAKQVRGDINFDRAINVLDVVLVTATYGSKSGDPNWNPESDVQPSGKIDILDVVVVTAKYGLKY